MEILKRAVEGWIGKFFRQEAVPEQI